MSGREVVDVQIEHIRAAEPPEPSEGFAWIAVVQPTRELVQSTGPRALILDLDRIGASPQRSRLIGGNAHAERYAAGAEIPYLAVQTWRAG